jgi:endonuclease-3
MSSWDASVTSPSSSSLAGRATAARIPLILRRLDRVTQRPAHARALPPLDSLVMTVLSQNTTDANSGRAFAQLREQFPTWEEVLQARPRRIAAAIRSGGLAETKSRRIKQILSHIEHDRGRLELGFLRRLPADRASQYLLSLPGVGRKTAAVVLLFSLGKAAFPVDTHVLRVSKRLGLIPPKTTMDRAHDLFAGFLKPEQMLDLHLGLIRHGRQVCTARRPRCAGCRLLDLCPRVGVAMPAGGER